MIHTNFNQFCLLKNGQGNGTEAWILAKKCLMVKTHLKFCYVYTNNASITQEMRFLYINGFILESCHICMESLIICLHRNVNYSKFIKKKFLPEIRPAHPPPPPPLTMEKHFVGELLRPTVRIFQASHSPTETLCERSHVFVTLI